MYDELIVFVYSIYNTVEWQSMSHNKMKKFLFMPNLLQLINIQLFSKIISVRNFMLESLYICFHGKT